MYPAYPFSLTRLCLLAVPEPVDGLQELPSMDARLSRRDRRLVPNLAAGPRMVPGIMDFNLSGPCELCGESLG